MRTNPVMETDGLVTLSQPAPFAILQTTLCCLLAPYWCALVARPAVILPVLPCWLTANILHAGILLPVRFVWHLAGTLVALCMHPAGTMQAPACPADSLLAILTLPTAACTLLLMTCQSLFQPDKT